MFLGWIAADDKSNSNHRLSLTDVVKGFGVFIQEFIFSFVRKVLPILYDMKIFRELGIPVGNIGGVDEVTFADVAKSFGKEFLFRLVAEIDRVFTHTLTG